MTNSSQQGKLRHVVLLKFKSDMTANQIQAVTTAFAALPTLIPEVESLEWGTNNSPEGLDRGFTHCFMITFRDAAAREVYLPHPEHLKFVAILKPRLEDVLVVDYWSD